MESSWDTGAALYEVAPAPMQRKEPLDGAPSAPSKIHHFTLYGRASKSSLAAFAAAQVWFENAVRAPRRETDRGIARSGLKTGWVQNYVVRCTASDRTAAPGDASGFNSAPPLPGSVSRRESGWDEHADIEKAQSGLAMSVTIGPKRAGAGKIPGGAAYEGLPRRGTYFTAVNGSLIHCVRTSADEPTKPLR
jgi:hypothetical protein